MISLRLVSLESLYVPEAATARAKQQVATAERRALGTALLFADRADPADVLDLIGALGLEDAVEALRPGTIDELTKRSAAP